MKEIQATIRPEMDQEEVAYLFRQYNLASAPVVDDAGRLTGMITIDDVVDVIQEEAEEDILALSGVSEAGVNQSVLSAVRARIPWLRVNLVTAFVAATVVSCSRTVIDHVVVLAFLMPVVAGLSGQCRLAGAGRRRARHRRARPRRPAGPPRHPPRGAHRHHQRRDHRLERGVWSCWSGSTTPPSAVVIGLSMMVTFTWAGLVGILAPLTLQPDGRRSGRRLVSLCADHPLIW